MRNRQFTWTVACLLASLAFATCAVAAGEEHEVARKAFQVSGKATVNVVTEIGKIDVVSGAAGSVEAVVTVDDRSMSKTELERFLERFDVTFDQRGDQVTVNGRWPEVAGGWTFFGRKTPSVTFRITVPRQADLDLSTRGGSIGVSDLEGAVKAKTSGGSLSFGHVTGSVWGRTSGGRITLDACDGNADVETSGGSISVGDVGGEVRAETSGGSISIQRSRGSVTAHTSGGSIKVEDATGMIDASTSGGSIHATLSEQPKGDCRLETSGGGVTVRLAPAVAVDIDARGGSIHCDLPVTVSGGVGHGALHGTINGGGPKLVLRTSGGGVRIEKL